MSTRCTKEFSISIDCIISTASPLPQGGTQTGSSIQFTQTGLASPFKWVLGAGAPPGLAFASDEGPLTGTPNTPGVYSFQVCCYKMPGPDMANGCCKTFEMTVVYEEPPDPPTTYYSAEIRASAFPDCFSLRMTAVDGTMAGQTCDMIGVAAAAFSSLISQEDADNQAWDQFGAQNTPGCGDFESDVIAAGGYVTYSCI